MAKSAVVQSMDDIQMVLGSTFKERGFRKRGRTYNRVTPDGLTHVVNFQTGASDPPAMTYHPGLRENMYGLFTVNLGVYVPEVAEADRSPAGSWVQEYHCTLRQRLAQTLGNSDDVWWRASADPEVVGEVLNGLLKGGFAFLDRFSSRDAVLDAVDKDVDHIPAAITPPRIIAAILLNTRGETERARERMQQQYVHAMAAGKTGHAETVMERMQRWGLA